MDKHTITKEDGRYLIYYTFRGSSGSGGEKRVPAPTPPGRADEEVMQSHVGTAVEPVARGVGRDGNS